MQCAQQDADRNCVGLPHLKQACYLSMFVVDAEGDGGGVQEQPRLLLIHLLPQALHATLTLRCFLNTHIQRIKKDI